MGSIYVEHLAKAYKSYSSRWSRFGEWILPNQGPRHSLNWILRDINFNVDSGEAVGIIGVNGAGKSTLLKMIAGTTKPTEGSIRIMGRVAAMLELGMGFHPDFTGRQNALMAGQLLGIDPEEMTYLLPEVEAFAEVGQYFDQPLRVYSSGMSVRLAFAVASAKRPDILIIDEALSVGDAYFQQKSFKRIRQFQADGTTLLLVSHDIAAVRNICHRVIWLDQGRVRRKGATKDVLDAYAASLYEKSQSINGLVGDTMAVPQSSNAPTSWARDLRQDFVNNSNLRNDIRVFNFDENAYRWGDGKVKISNVRITDSNGSLLSWMIGGEDVRLTIEAHALCDINSVVLGFIVRDRLGQALFGDNTFLSTVMNPISAGSGQNIEAAFRFLMPILPHGSYSVTVAVATGTQDDHVINDWIDQAVLFDSHNRSAVSGMVGIPMHQIDISAV
jgi:lipopolysaccharide transport system ATP-binding protein